MQLQGNGEQAAVHCTLFAILLNWLYKGAMTKPDDERPESYAGLTSTDHTPFKQAVGAELEKMSQRLYYSPGAFRLVQILDGDEPGSRLVKVWGHDSTLIDVRVPDESPAAIAEALEAALKEYDQYKERFEQADSEND